MRTISILYCFSANKSKSLQQSSFPEVPSSWNVGCPYVVEFWLPKPFVAESPRLLAPLNLLE